MDIVILTKDKDDEEEQGNEHIIYLPELEASKSLFYQTAQLISVANFRPNLGYRQNLGVERLVLLHSEMVTSLSEKEDIKNELRNFLSAAYYLKTHQFLNSAELDEWIAEVRKNPLEKINYVMQELLMKFSSPTYIKKLIKDNSKLMGQYVKVDHLKVLNELYQKVLRLWKT